MLQVTQLIGFGTNSHPMSDKWRILMDGKPFPGGHLYHVPEVEMADVAGGANLCSTIGGTPSANSYWYNDNPDLDYPPEDAFDGNISLKMWQSAYVTSLNPSPHWLGFTFNKPVAIVEVRLLWAAWPGPVPAAATYVHLDVGTSTSIQYEQNGVWRTVKTFTSLATDTSHTLGIQI